MCSGLVCFVGNYLVTVSILSVRTISYTRTKKPGARMSSRPFLVLHFSNSGILHRNESGPLWPVRIKLQQCVYKRVSKCSRPST